MNIGRIFDILKIITIKVNNAKKGGVNNTTQRSSSSLSSKRLCDLVFQCPACKHEFELSVTFKKVKKERKQKEQGEGQEEEGKEEKDHLDECFSSLSSVYWITKTKRYRPSKFG